MSGLGPVVSLLWKELGLAPPLDPVGTKLTFDLGEVAMELDLADNGDTVIVRGQIGYLEANAHEAGDQLSRVLRLGLGLTALNGAVLDASRAEDLLDRDHAGRVPVFAVATALLSAPATILPAVRAVLDWQTATETILIRDDGGSDPASRSREPANRTLDTDLIIFQP